MRLEHSLSSAQRFFENLGYCQFSSFLPDMDKDKAVLVEMVARLFVGVFAAVSAYDLMNKNLPLAAKIVVHGTVLCIVTSLGLNMLLKKIAPVAEERIQEPLKEIEDQKTEVVSYGHGKETESHESEVLVEDLFVDIGPQAPKPVIEQEVLVAEMEKPILNDKKIVGNKYALPPSPQLDLSPLEIRRMFPKARRNLMADFNRLAEEDKLSHA